MYTLLKLLQIAVLAGVLLSPLVCSSENEESNMIVGGFKVSIEDVPYQVALFRQNSLICGGTIIGPQWILTAFHCVETLNLTQYSVVVGTTDPYSGNKLKPKKFIVPPETIADKSGLYDVTLVLLEQPLTFSKNVQCLSLLSSSVSIVPGKPAYISGFGTSYEGGFDHPLKAATINLLPESMCANAYSWLMKSHMICAGFEKGLVDSCQGDSGGPLVVDGKLAGVIFFGLGCARPNLPGVYQSVPYFYDWIVSVVHEQPLPAEQKLCGEK